MFVLEDTVRSVVKDFMDNDQLFTALDVSNKVKSSNPNVRHREVRDVVRSIFVSDIEAQGWARTPIKVSLSDGSTAEALLYHPLSAAWDLDNRYSQQQRSQVVANPVTAAAAVVAQAVTVPTLTNNVATAATATPAAGAATVTLSATTPVPMPTARDLWDQLFASQPSLFPTK